MVSEEAVRDNKEKSIADGFNVLHKLYSSSSSSLLLLLLLLLLLFTYIPVLMFSTIFIRNKIKVKKWRMSDVL